jgi:6-phosphogluconolactonase
VAAAALIAATIATRVQHQEPDRIPVAPHSEMPAHRLWIGGGGSIQPWEMELATGALRSTASAIDVDGAGGFLEPSVDGLAIYATANVGAAAFSVDPTTGALTHINTMESELGGNPHISLLAGEGEIGPWEAVVLSSYGGGGTSILRVNPEDRSLASGSSASHGETGSGVDPGRQEAPHPHSAFVAPSTGSAGRVVVSDLGTDELIAYDVDGPAGCLTRVSTFASNPGAGPRHLSFHPNSQWIYSINELDCTMTVLSYSAETGALGPALQTLSTLPDGYDFRNHSSGTALNAEGGPASGPNSSGDFGNKAHVGT